MITFIKHYTFLSEKQRLTNNPKARKALLPYGFYKARQKGKKRKAYAHKYKYITECFHAKC